MKENINLYSITMSSGKVCEILAVNIQDAMRYIEETNGNFVQTIVTSNVTFSVKTMNKLFKEE